MRHRKKLNHLSRKSEHRKAMLANMAISLIEHKRITTTVAKAKALRVYVEPLITKAKEDTTNSRRQVFSYLQNKNAVTELFRDVAGKVGERPGGYTRILKTGTRFGDNADMCIIELVDYNENMLAYTGEGAKEKPGTRRSRRGTRKKPADAAKPVVAADKPEEITEEPGAGSADAVAEEEPAAESSDIQPENNEGQEPEDENLTEKEKEE